MDRIIVIGGGGHAKVVIAMLRKSGTFLIKGYVAPENRGPILEAPWLGNDADLVALSRQGTPLHAAMGIGHPRSADVRRSAHTAITQLGIKFKVVLDNTAVVADAVCFGEGSVIMAGAVVQPGTKTGLCAIINTNATVDHDCLIEDFVHIGPGAVLCGGVVCADGSLIGAGSVILPSCRIGRDCIIGAGAVVTEDCMERGIYVGSPARRIK